MFLIDGYNLLHVAFPGRATRDSRERLVGEVVEFCRRRGYRARIVFDATGDLPRRQRHGDVEIRNVAPGRSADEEILSALASTRDRTAHTLVTDDQALVREAKRRGVRVVPCRDFLRLLESPGHEPGFKEAGPVSPGEVDAWMREFGLEGEGGEE